VEALGEVATYVGRICARQRPGPRPTRPTRSSPASPAALEEFPPSELEVLSGLRSFIAVGVLVRLAQVMLSAIVTAFTNEERNKSSFTLLDIEAQL
jgi:hypothetical protein